ncbi:MAG: hypothetical protein ACFB9M_00070 [Myxococcota bacterium]
MFGDADKRRFETEAAYPLLSLKKDRPKQIFLPDRGKAYGEQMGTTAGAVDAAVESLVAQIYATMKRR